MNLSKHNLNKIIYLISFVDLLAVGVSFPAFVPFLRSLGISHTAVGVLSSVYSGLQVISGPIIGSWSDVRGKKTVFLITMCASTVCYLFLGLSTSVMAIFCIRFILGLFKHTQVIIKAMIADTAAKGDSANIFGTAASFGSLGFVIGPLISGHLSEMSNGFFYVTLVTAFLFLVNICLVCLLPNDTTTKHMKTSQISNNLRTQFTQSMRNLQTVSWYSYWSTFTLKFLFVLPTTMYFVSQPSFLFAGVGMGGLTQRHVGYAISYVSALGVASGLLIGPLTRLRWYATDGRGYRRVAHAFAMTTGCLAAMYYVTGGGASTVITWAVLLSVFGVANAVLRISTMEMTFVDVSPGDRGALSGAADSVKALGRFVGPLVAGVLSDLYGVRTVMLGAALPSAVGCVLSFYLLHDCQHNNSGVKNNRKKRKVTKLS